MTSTSPVQLTVTDGIATVLLNRPEARNAVNLETCLALQEIFAMVEDQQASVVVIRAAGPVFCAGADLKERTDKDAAWVRRRRLASFAAYESIERCRLPVIAAVHGTVVGSGGEISMAADFIVAADSARFRFPEVHWGTVGATQRLQRVIGKRSAKELLFTNRVLEAAEAYRLGLVQRLIAQDAFDHEVAAIAARIAEAPSESAMLTKRAVDLGEEVPLDHGIRIEMAAIEQNLAGTTWREGIARFTSGEETS